MLAAWPTCRRLDESCAVIPKWKGQCPLLVFIGDLSERMARRKWGKLTVDALMRTKVPYILSRNDLKRLHYMLHVTL